MMARPGQDLAPSSWASDVSAEKYRERQRSGAERFKPTQEQLDADKAFYERRAEAMPKTVEYANRRLDLKDADGNPLKPEVANLIIQSVQLEANQMLADMVRANMTDGTEMDFVKYDRAMLLSARAMDAAYRLAQEQNSSEPNIQDVLSRNVFADRKDEGLNKILNQPPTENTPPTTPEAPKE